MNMHECQVQMELDFTAERTVVKEKGFDKWLLLAVIFLLLFGIVMVYSSTSVVTPVIKNGTEVEPRASQFLFLGKHLMSVILGGIFMYLAYRIDLKNLHAAAYIILAVSFVMLVLVFVPGFGISANGARRWIRFWPSTIQPSEFVKVAMVIWLARYLSSPSFDRDSLFSYLKPLFVMGVFQGLFMKQPDFGATVTLGLLTFTLLFLAGVKKRFLLSTAALAIPVVIKLVMVPYRLKRVMAFLDPWSDQHGSGYQLVQSFIALGSGGFAGIGIGESKQKLDFLPYINTDFIFSLMGEETGFFGVSIAVILFCFIFYKGIRISSKDPGSFQYYLGQGLTCFIVYQMLINVAVVTGLAPTKGLPLPFISYGGSSLLANMISVGILLNLSKGYVPIAQKEKKVDILERKKARISRYGRGTGSGKLW